MFAPSLARLWGVMCRLNPNGLQISGLRVIHHLARSTLQMSATRVSRQSDTRLPVFLTRRQLGGGAVKRPGWSTPRLVGASGTILANTFCAGGANYIQGPTPLLSTHCLLPLGTCIRQPFVDRRLRAIRGCLAEPLFFAPLFLFDLCVVIGRKAKLFHRHRGLD